MVVLECEMCGLVGVIYILHILRITHYFSLSIFLNVVPNVEIFQLQSQVVLQTQIIYFLSIIKFSQ